MEVEAAASSSPVRRRTRQAITEAAITTWVRNREASLDDVARAAEVHRATLHRHFASRAELLDAAVRHCVDEIVAATDAAALDLGPPIEAIRRVIAAYFGIGDQIRFLFEDLVTARHPAVTELAAGEGPVLDLIRRAQVDGSADATQPAAWVERTIWALVFAASEAVDDGTIAAHEALPVLLRTVERGITGP